jgi:hypothetical protein
MTDHPIQVALRAIGDALLAVWGINVPEVDGPATGISPLGDFIVHTIYEFPDDTPADSAHRDRVEEGLIGAALALAQTHLDYKGRSTPVQDKLWHAANYWKHRDSAKGLWPLTVSNVVALGARQPLTPHQAGDLRMIAGLALGRPFDVAALWDAIK